jgi:hypothetical protein
MVPRPRLQCLVLVVAAVTCATTVLYYQFISGGSATVDAVPIRNEITDGLVTNNAIQQVSVGVDVVVDTVPRVVPERPSVSSGGAAPDVLAANRGTSGTGDGARLQTPHGGGRTGVGTTLPKPPPRTSLSPLVEGNPRSDTRLSAAAPKAPPKAGVEVKYIGFMVIGELFKGFLFGPSFREHLLDPWRKLDDWRIHVHVCTNVPLSKSPKKGEIVEALRVAKAWYWDFNASHQMQRIGKCASLAVTAAMQVSVSYDWMIRWRIDLYLYATPLHPSKLHVDCLYVRLRGVRGLDKDPLRGALITGDMFQRPVDVNGTKCGWRHPRKPNVAEDSACVTADDTVFYVPSYFIGPVLLAFNASIEEVRRRIGVAGHTPASCLNLAEGSITRAWLYHTDDMRFCPIAVRGFIGKKLGQWGHMRRFWNTKHEPEYCDKPWASWMSNISAGRTKYKKIQEVRNKIIEGKAKKAAKR